MAETVDNPAGTEQAGAAEGKYLTFVLGDEEYGIAILKVREIIGLMSITKIPRTPVFVKGVINLRGKVIPVVDLRLKFGMPETAYTEATCIIVVEVRNMMIGLVVDTVSEVRDIAGDDIDPPPEFGRHVRTDFIRGMGKLKEQVVILLDIEAVLSLDELGMLEGLEAGDA